MTTDTADERIDPRGHPDGSIRHDADLDASDEALLGRIGAASEIDGTALAAARARTWTRLVGDHPALDARRRAAPRQPSTARLGIIPFAGGIGRRGAWRTVADLGAVAAVLFGLILGSTGIDLVPDGDGSWALSTQSAAAATSGPDDTPPPADAVQPQASPTVARTTEPVATPLALVLERSVRHTPEDDR